MTKAEDILATADLSAKAEQIKNDIKADLFRMIEAVDEGTFRGGFHILFDPVEGKNILTIWGDRLAVNSAAIRMLRQGGILK